ncbi:MAG: CpXC domain-containing protein [Candidatus Xenobia bacterium]
MTENALQPVRCPQCGQEFVAPLLDSINVLQHPEQREALLAGEVNVPVCPTCQTRFHVPRPILYFDARRGILVWCYPPTDEEKQKQILEEHRKLISQQFALLPAQLRPRKVRYIFGGLDELIDVVMVLETTPSSQEA